MDMQTGHQICQELVTGTERMRDYGTVVGRTVHKGDGPAGLLF